MSRHHESGQTIIALLIFMMLAIAVTTVAAMITITNIRTNNAYSGGEQALANAESGAENALQRLLRDPGYTGESLALPNGAATISISGASVKTIVSEGTVNNYHRTITVTASYTSNVLVPTSWSETP
jgi:hypothetical protein